MFSSGCKVNQWGRSSKYPPVAMSTNILDSPRLFEAQVQLISKVPQFSTGSANELCPSI
jgi:hypothetical protein